MRNNVCSKTLALAAAVALVPTVALTGAAHARDYQFEGGLSYIDFDRDFGASDSAIGLDLAWYWDGVRTGGLPLAAAAFYNRSSNLQLGYLTFDKADFDTTVLGGEYYHDRIYLALDYYRFSNGATSNDFEIGVGYVPVDGLRIAARYWIADSSDATGSDAITAEVKYVTPLAGGTALNLEGSLSFFDDELDTKLYSVEADYFFNPAFSLGARFTYHDYDVGSNTGWGIGTQYFFTPTVSGAVEYFSEDFGDTLALRIAARF